MVLVCVYVVGGMGWGWGGGMGWGGRVFHVTSICGEVNLHILYPGILKISLEVWVT